MKTLRKTPGSNWIVDRCHFLDQLGSAPVDEAIPILEEMANHSDPDIRSCALDGLEKIAPERAEELALRFLHDPDDGLRWHGLYYLATRCNKAVVPQVARMLVSDPDELVRSFAALYLGALGDESVLPALRHAVEHDTGCDHEDTPIKYTAERSIRMIRDRLSGRSSPTYIPALNLIWVGPDSEGQGS